MTVPLFDTETPLAPLREALIESVSAVIRSGRFILGPEVEAFEHELAEYLGARHVVAVGNGTDALTIAVRAAGVQAGDEVVVPSLTFYATAEAVAALGAVPVFADVDYGTRNLTPETVMAALTPRTRAVVSVDLFGVPAASAEIKRATGLPVIEDAAQAIGASLDGRRTGLLGDVGTFSFYPSKNLGALGDGGAIVTDDERIAELARQLRFHGSKDKQSFEHVGYNSRLDALQAAALRVLLPHLDSWCEGRRAGAQAYVDAGLDRYLTLPQTPAGALPAWHLYVAAAQDADAQIAKLTAAGVQARAYYRTPLHRQPAMARYAPRRELPVTDELARTIIALPISPVFTRAQAEEVVAALAA